jgi:hypothetical protein
VPFETRTWLWGGFRESGARLELCPADVVFNTISARHPDTVRVRRIQPAYAVMDPARDCVQSMSLFFRSRGA